MPPRRKRPLSGAAKAAHEKKIKRLAEETAAEVEEAAGEATGKEASSMPVDESKEGPSPEPPKSPTPPAPDDDMNDYPRQEDWRQLEMSQENQPEMEISELDVHSLLAFASLVTHKTMRTFNMERRTRLDPKTEPTRYATKKPWRLAKCLDSLANICVSKEKHEVIAVASRFSGENIEIIVASNDDVPDETIEHMKKVWGLLRQISAALHGNTEHQKDDSTPTKIQDTRAHDLAIQFELEVVKFTYARIQNKLFAKPRTFDTSLPHHMKVKDAVEKLREVLRENNKSKPKERLDDLEWELIRGRLKKITEMVDTWPSPPSEVPRSSLEKYVGKIAGIGADFNTLVRAASSPRCKDVFKRTPIFTPIAKEERTIPSFPTTLVAWTKQMERPVAFYNLTKHQNFSPIGIFHEYCVLIACKKFPVTAPVHCEVKVATHIFKEENDRTTMKPEEAYPYIGVSKLSCVGCNHFLSAFNNIHNTRFITKGLHSKAYYPWVFPDTCPRSQDVLESHYEKLNSWFVPWYSGYKQCTYLGPDSTAQSDPSGSALFEERTNEELDEMQRKRYKPTMEDVGEEELEES